MIGLFVREALKFYRNGENMIKIDLITGFLGSGKTTFLKLYAKKLVESGEKICIIENDFGAINVDMVFLKDLISENCNLEMIVGGDGDEAHKRRLKTKLISMGMQGYSRVIIEPSGIFDLDEFFDLLYEDPLDRWYEIGNIICIVDANLEEKLSNESEYLLMSEAASAGKIVISKVQSNEDSNIKRISGRLMRVMQKLGCSRVISSDDIIAKKWSEFDENDYRAIINCGFNKASYEKLYMSSNDKFQTIFYFDFKMNDEELRQKVNKVFKDDTCGKVIRIKGFINGNNGEKFEINATQNEIVTNTVSFERAVLIIIGEKINKEGIIKYFGNPSL